jgi:hypothetical protein
MTCSTKLFLNKLPRELRVSEADMQDKQALGADSFAAVAAISQEVLKDEPVVRPEWWQRSSHGPWRQPTRGGKGRAATTGVRKRPSPWPTPGRPGLVQASARSIGSSVPPDARDCFAPCKAPLKKFTLHTKKSTQPHTA